MWSRKNATHGSHGKKTNQTAYTEDADGKRTTTEEWDRKPVARGLASHKRTAKQTIRRRMIRRTTGESSQSAAGRVVPKSAARLESRRAGSGLTPMVACMGDGRRRTGR